MSQTVIRPTADRPEEAIVSSADLPIRSVPVKHYGQWVAAVVLLALVAVAGASLARNPNIDWATVGDYLFDPVILRGLGVTFELAGISMVIGVVLGIGVAAARMSSNRVLQGFAWAYIWFFRGVPLLVQLLVWGSFALIAPNVFGMDTNTLVTPFVAAILAFSLNEGAYMAEVVRGGLLAVDRGQVEAATALGMTPAQTMRRITMPQALRIIIPPSANQFITLIKTTALVAVIAGQDLMSVAQNISATSYRVMEMLFVASIWYLAVVSVLTVGQQVLERRLAKGVQR